MTMAEREYPGQLASPQQIHELAHSSFQLGRSGKPLTQAPFRLSAIHAIELYLTALLLHGHSPNQIRKTPRHSDWSTSGVDSNDPNLVWQYRLNDLRSDRFEL
ncbi:hypothetical protein ACWGS9_32600 [Bradyrhizobium sp. Arg314]